MTWAHWLTDAKTGLIDHPVDIASFSWRMTVSDFGFSTLPRDPSGQAKNPGDTDVSSLVVPFDAFHADSQASLAAKLAMGRRALCTAWRYDGCADDRGVPLMWGVLGERHDTWWDTTFPLYSPLTLMDSRYVIREGRFATGKSTDTVTFQNLSLRGVAAECGYLGVQAKNGGTLPIDWNYRGEKGSHQRMSYQAWNVQNLSVKHVQTNLSNVINGPDMTYRPYWSDSQHARVNFLAGSDGDVFLDMKHPPIVLNAFPGGGSLGDMEVDYSLPYQRVYATGSGTDAATITAYAEDMSQITGAKDPPILRELAWSDSDVDKKELLLPKAQALLKASSRPLMQLTGSLNADDRRPDGYPAHPLGSFWPGEMFYIDLKDHRTLPDGRYETRLMEMSGDESSTVKLKFDVMEAPF